MKKIFTSVFILTLGFFYSHAAVAGNPVAASVNEHMVITLPADQPLAEQYVLDVTNVKFVSADVMQQFCNNFSEHSFMMTADFANNRIIIDVIIGKDSAGNVWDAAKWNEYLAQRAPKMEMFVQTMNK